MNPRLVAILRRHVDTFGVTADGRLFRSGKDGPVKAIRYLARWRQAREIALTPAEQASPLARRLYDLRHAAVSGWLNAGVPVTQVAEWAGHCVRVCLLVYAKCISGGDEAARRRIDAVLAAESGTADVIPAERPAVWSTNRPPRAGHDRTGPDAAGQQPAPGRRHTSTRIGTLTSENAPWPAEMGSDQPRARWRLMTMRWIWLVPSKICMILASRM
ncbi:hypothetical protein [Frankia gtarii]|uniref:hypothetical protein n=1 Tax=Frankia gtarii TaxID=2950102 RepID=UPI0021BECD6C|nr:hypothetical protein [Frankia gtarii]